MAATFPKPGPPGTEETPFVHTQGAPSSSFTIDHGLNRVLVSVTAYDALGNEVQVGVQVLDNNNVQVTTDSGLPFSGKCLVL
jgi:hypothetical protein